MEWISLAGIVAVIALFAILCFKGIPVTVSAPLLSIALWLFGVAAGDTTTFDGAVSVFAAGAATAVERYLLMFMFSALFGSLIREAGIAAAIGDFFSNLIMRTPRRWRKLCTVGVVPLINAILTYSGVSLFVVVFAVVAIVRDLFQRMDIPWHLYAMSMIGSATFTAGLLPGSPSIESGPNRVLWNDLDRGSGAVAHPLCREFGSRRWVYVLCAVENGESKRGFPAHGPGNF